MRPSGRTWDGPTARLVELVDPGDPTAPAATALELHPAYRGLPALHSALDHGRGFLVRPMVFGVAPLLHADLESGRLRYETGTSWSVAELLAAARSRRVPLGPRAGAELAWLAGCTLAEAAESGEMQGVFCHGDVSPWRLVVRHDGELSILGYGIPELEHQRLRHLGRQAPEAAAFGYAPPERLASVPEGLRSDLFSLALVVAEVVTGRPVYATTPDAGRADAARGDAARRLARLDLAPRLRGLLASMLAARPEARPSAASWTEAWHALLIDGCPGPTLAEAIGEARRGGPTHDAADPTQPDSTLPTRDVAASRALPRSALADRRAPAPPRAPAPSGDRPAPTTARPSPSEPREPVEGVRPRRVTATPERLPRPSARDDAQVRLRRDDD